MFKWLREYYEIKEDSKFCDSCETLKEEVSYLRRQNTELIDKIISKPEEPLPLIKPEHEPKLVTPGSHRSWAVRRQMLEERDRNEAQILKQREKDLPKSTTLEKLEEEILGDKDAAV